MSAATRPRTWIFFGDDWGAHPSTTQHLARALLERDRVIWIDSIAMRSLRFDADELGRVTRRLRARRAARGSPRSSTSARQPHVRLSPSVVPLHRAPPARAFNRALLRRQLRDALARVDGGDPIVVAATPVAAHYLDVIAPRRVVYLRLDDYARLPGVDAALVADTEPAMIARADLVAATARPLLPADARRSLYLPQGVDVAHFGRAPLEPPRSKVIGFFGLLAEWIDDALIVDAARARPDWTFELIGPARADPTWRANAPNIVWRGPVPYGELPDAIARWDAAWIPFVVDELTRAVNPVKLREYLAAGLPTFSTPLPEAGALGDLVTIGRSATDVSAFLDAVAHDTVARRSARRTAMDGDTWASRATALVDAIGA